MSFYFPPSYDREEELTCGTNESPLSALAHSVLGSQQSNSFALWNEWSLLYLELCISTASTPRIFFYSETTWWCQWTFLKILLVQASKILYFSIALMFTAELADCQKGRKTVSYVLWGGVMLTINPGPWAWTTNPLPLNSMHSPDRFRILIPHMRAVARYPSLLSASRALQCCRPETLHSVACRSSLLQALAAPSVLSVSRNWLLDTSRISVKPELASISLVLFKCRDCSCPTACVLCVLTGKQPRQPPF